MFTRTQRSKAAAAALAVGLALSFWSTSAATAAPVSAPTAEPDPTSGCGRAPVGSGSRTLSYGGESRGYVLDVPSGYDRDEPTPIVFAFHGLGSSGATFRSYSGFVSATSGQAVVVHPDASASARRIWQLEADTGFFDALLADLGSRLCLDTDRVFATGHSMGAIFTNHLACSRGDVLKAVAPVAGGWPNGDRPCSGRVAAWVAHGNPDPIVPFENGPVVRDAYRRLNGCTNQTRPVGSGVRYVRCDRGLEVRWVEHDQGHGFPRFVAPEAFEFFMSRK